MQSHHYVLIVLALIVGYLLAGFFPGPGQMVKQAVTGG